MKKYLHPRILPVFVPVAGLLGMLLRIWTLGSGPDRDGLYAPQPVAWTLLWVLTGLVVLALLLIPSRLKNPGKYGDNFPPSIAGAIGCGLAAFVVIYSGLTLLLASQGLIVSITGFLGLLSGICLMITAVNRCQGQKPMFLLHAIPCLYFALRVFDRCRHWSNEPQLSLFLFPFLASICVMLAVYQMATFDVNLGKRRPYLFWSLSGVYLCMVAMPGEEEFLFYGAMAIWLVTNLCSLRPIVKRKPQPSPESEESPEGATESAPAEEAAPEAPAKTAEDMSMDELMNWLDNK